MPRRCRVTGKIEQCYALALPGSGGLEPERMWLSVLIDELDGMNIKLQRADRGSLVTRDTEPDVDLRRARATGAEKDDAERERRH